MSVENQPSIPDVCADCPVISPYFKGIGILEGQLGILTKYYLTLAEKTPPEIIDRRIAEIETKLLTHRAALANLALGTVGCDGVSVGSAHFDDEPHIRLTCSSILMK